MKRKLVIPAVLIASATLLGGIAVAKQDGAAPNDAIADVANAKINLTQAIAVAEQHAGGTATKAELEQERGVLAYEVEVVAGQKVTEVQVAANDGTVLASKADENDGQDKNDREDDDGERNDDR